MAEQRYAVVVTDKAGDIEAIEHPNEFAAFLYAKDLEQDLTLIESIVVAPLVYPDDT